MSGVSTIASEGVANQPVSESRKETKAANSAYYPALDGLRAIAFLMVFGLHYLGLAWGWAGVDLFFVLSGFLITGILLDSRDDLHRVRNFYARRTLRIFPLYYAVFLLLVVTYPVFRWQWNWAWLGWPLYLGNWVQLLYHFAPVSELVSASRAHLASARFPRVALFLGHFWTLCIEEQFYLIWPCIVFQVRSHKKLIWICCVGAVLCPLLRMAQPYMLPAALTSEGTTAWITPYRLDGLLIGGLLALLRRGAHAQTLSIVARRALVILAIVAALWLVATAWRFEPWDYNYPSWSGTWGITYVNVLGATLLIAALDAQSVVYRFLNHGTLRWLGRISYGAYVFHDIPHPMFRRAALHFFPENWQIVTAAIGLAYTLVLAWASFRFYESRFIALKARFTKG